MLAGLHYQPRTYLQVGVTAFVLAVLLTPVAIFLLRRFGVIDQGGNGKFHRKPVPRGGGVAIFLAFTIAVLIPNYRDHPMKGVLIGSGICLIVGMIDDIRGVPAVLKLLTLFAVTLIMSYFGVRVDLFKFYPLDLFFTLLWIVGVTSAFNGIDNMDGLAAGVAAIVSAMYLTIAVQAFLKTGTETSLSWFGLLAAGLLGANLGFLIFNFRPARVFMGDSGSFFLGFTVAALGVMGEWTENRVVSCTIPVLILGVPIFDFAYIIIARILRGETRTLRDIVEHCALDHLSHRLMWIGFSQCRAVLFIYLICAVLGVSGILLRNSTGVTDTILAMSQGLAIIFIIVVLMAAAMRRHISAVHEEAELLEKEGLLNKGRDQ